MKLLFFLLLPGSSLLSAQDLKWNQGSVVLSTGTVITGRISITPGQNLIIFRRSKTKIEPGQLPEGPQGAAALPAHKLKAVFY